MGQSLVMQSQLEHLPRGASSPVPGAGIASQKSQARVSDACKKSTSAWQALKTHQSPPNLLLPTQQFSVPGRKNLKKKETSEVLGRAQHDVSDLGPTFGLWDLQLHDVLG